MGWEGICRSCLRWLARRREFERWLINSSCQVPQKVILVFHFPSNFFLLDQKEPKSQGCTEISCFLCLDQLSKRTRYPSAFQRGIPQTPFALHTTPRIDRRLEKLQNFCKAFLKMRLLNFPLKKQVSEAPEQKLSDELTCR